MLFRSPHLHCRFVSGRRWRRSWKGQRRRSMCCLPCTQPECLHRWESIEERKICRAVKELSSSKAARGTSRIELAHQSALYHSFHHLWHRKLNSFVKSTSTDNSVSFQNHKTECHSVINAQQHGVHRLFFSHVLFPESACA